MSEDDNNIDRRRFLTFAGATGAAAMAGCSGGGDNNDGDDTGGDDAGGDDTGSDDTGSDDTGGDDTAEDEDTGDEEEPVTVGVTMGQMDSGLDPHDHAETNTDIIVSQTYEGLMGRDPDGAVIAKLATNWERVEAGTARFTLREGVTFHNGDAVTPEDVRFSIRRIELEEVGGAFPQDGDLNGTGSLDSVETGDGEVTVNFGGLNPIVFALFATNGQIMQQSWVEENDEGFINRNMNGTGPFQFANYDQGNEVLVERYDGYWDDAASVDAVSLTASSEASTRVNQLLAEESDIVTNVPPQEVSRVQDSDVASIAPVPSTRVIFLQMRFDVEPFSSQQFRQAMNHAVNNQGIIENVLQTFGNVSAQPTLSQFTGHNPDIEPYEHDPERAEQLVEESGFAGVEITLQTPIGRYLLDVSVAQAAADDIDSLSNVTCNLEQREFNSLVQDVTAPSIEDRPEFNLLGWGNAEFDAAQTITPLLTSDGPLTVLKNDEIDGLIEDAQSEPDAEQRVEILQEANQRLHELAPWVFMHQQFSLYGVANRIDWDPRPDELIDPYRASTN